MFIHLTSKGYAVETLGCAFTEFNASRYGALLLIDSEGEYTADDRAKLYADVVHLGLSLVVLADWCA